ncbi:MAG: ATPase P [Bacteroidetes bacterium]|nr:MAG: ATPase P [Bacteroidota bacterium]
MIKIDIPGYGILELEHLVMDYNGTLALDGNLFKGLEEILNRLSENIHLHVITADTFGQVSENLKNVKCNLHIIGKENQGKQKQEYVINLDASKVCAIGNGANDGMMLKTAALGIALIQTEGANVNTLLNADIVSISIFDALGLLMNPKRLVASMRE